MMNSEELRVRGNMIEERVRRASKDFVAEWRKETRKINNKLDALIAAIGDEKALSALAKKLKRSTASLKSAVKANQPPPTKKEQT